MEKLLIFAAVFGAAYAGSRILSPQESVPRLNDFQRLCASGRVPASGALVDLEGEKTWVYCKKAGGTVVHEDTAEKTFDVPEPPPQAVFVNPADISLKQRVLVTGTVKAPKTKIFYVPPKVDTTVDVDVQSQTEAPRKPTVYFLNSGDSGSSNSGGYQKVAPPQEPPRGLYLPPRARSQDLVGAASAQVAKVAVAPNQDESSLEDASLADYSDSDAPAAAEEDPVSKHQKREIESVENIFHMFKVNGEDGKPRMVFLRRKY